MGHGGWLKLKFWQQSGLIANEKVFEKVKLRSVPLEMKMRLVEELYDSHYGRAHCKMVHGAKAWVFTCLICPYYIPKSPKHLCAAEGSLFGPLINHFN